MRATLISVGMCVVGTLGAFAQQPVMGTVSTQDAQVSGGLEVQGDRARLLTNASVTAKDHTAGIALARGGEVLVCSTSQFHLLHAGAGQGLLFGLDRGALELHTRADTQDVILTPDMRFTMETAGEFDLRLRVMRNGDTCVDNAGRGSPVLVLNAAFGGASYRLMPGQHVLFERGNLREVVDHERSACGCPQAVPLPANATAAQRAAAAHPFPEDEAAGLAPVTAAANATGGGEGTQMSAALVYGQAPGAGGDAEVVGAAAEPRRGFFGRVGHFFHRLFRRGS